jgi:AmmeMemoRadiSam system protein B
MTYTKSTPLPPIRYDITGYEALPGIVVLYDDQLYAEHTIQLPSHAVEYLMLLDGERDAETLAEQAALSGRPFSVDEFVDVVNILERENFLESERFRRHRAELHRAFNESLSRPPAHAGNSYTDDPVELREMLDGFLAADTTDHADAPPPAAVIAPHIDFRVGGESYGPAYNRLRRSDADTFVIFGVSHQMSYDKFMMSKKDFETPLGSLPADREFIDAFRANVPFELTSDEIAHRREHSIEFQAVFLRHIFPDRDIRIVPILTGSLYEYVELGEGNASDDTQLTQLYDALELTANQLGRKVCYIAGADMCHVGHKFGDDFPAQTILDEVRQFDLSTLAHTATPNADGFLRSISSVRNQYRVCGVAPIYATLRAAKPTRGELLCYDQWDESEKESAVTFASVALYK